MLNFALGSPADTDGHHRILTRPNEKGHAVYGPYDHMAPGRYVVEFTIAPVDDQVFRKDFICAVLDVVVQGGQRQIARQDVHLSSLAQGPAKFVLPFELTQSHRVEFRVGVNGKVPLIIDDHRRVVALEQGETDFAARLESEAFPVPEADAAPAFFLENIDRLRHMHRDGVNVRLMDDQVILRMKGVSFFARSVDDFNFIGEVFFQSAYNFLSGRKVCVIDIGMNIGLVSLQFASKAIVTEVHSFEPFQATFNRAMANLSINPVLAAKIWAHNIGLSDHDEDGTLLVAEGDDSGARSIYEVDNGVPVQLTIRHAAKILRPIIEQARSKDLDVIIKVDCEGSEFAIFEALAADDLLKDVSAFMVEWHQMFDDKTQSDLIDPLLNLGFLVFDLSKAGENGFFYAVRAA